MFIPLPLVFLFYLFGALTHYQLALDEQADEFTALVIGLFWPIWDMILGMLVLCKWIQGIGKTDEPAE